MAVIPFGSGRIDKLLDIIFTKQCTYIGAQTFAEWDMIKKLKATDPLARSLVFRVVSSLGYAAAGAGRSPGAKYSFPRASLSRVPEFSANYKEKATTIALSYSLYQQAQLAKSAKALEPLALEMTSKATAEARIMAAEFWLDGTGVRATVTSVDETAIASGRIVVQLTDTDTTRGHASCCELGDILYARSILGAARLPTGGAAATFYGYLVVAKNRFTQQVTLDFVDSNENVIVPTASNLVATDVFYRVDGQETWANLTSNATVGDYGTATEIMPGIESIASADGRTTFGMTSTGAFASAHVDVGTDALDAIMIDRALGEAQDRMGEGRFKYKQMIMDDPSHRQLIDSRETDRRFNTFQDKTRGTTYFAYQHRTQNVRAVVSEYVRRRVWFLPEGNAGEKVLEYHGTDWTQVKLPNGNSQFLNPATDGRLTNEMAQFKTQRGVLIDRVPGAIACIRNYSLSVA